ncbi:MAG: hypothetical protein EPO08_02465 [Rhodospirillaceae bacterium]|nr:MAG: hypothetical protein EPO08_02465 [Rhodospirillaceae bacterium]
MCPNDTKQWCFAWYANEALDGKEKRAGLIKDKKWAPGDTITISFLDGTDEQKNLVKKFAPEWVTNLANLRFSWQAGPNTHIRISFKYKGSWSVIGTTCKTVPQNQPTMNFGWLTPGVSDDEARRVILHEFGHALGLIHEHQNPMNQIDWNKPAVIADLSGPPNNWDQATIQHNMFDAYAISDLNATPVDRQSIMMYPLPASWLKSGSPVGLNATLSTTDKSFVRAQYP